jgi:hypothetical protein
MFTDINPKADPENDTIPENNSGVPEIRNGTHLSPTFLKRGLNNILFEQKPRKDTCGTTAWHKFGSLLNIKNKNKTLIFFTWERCIFSH